MFINNSRYLLFLYSTLINNKSNHIRGLLLINCIKNALFGRIYFIQYY
jgi:hypothetical protein